MEHGYNSLQNRIRITCFNYGAADMPEGTIATEAYYSDVFIPVELK